MINPLDVFRRLRPAPADPYGVDEILAILRGEQEGERAEQAIEVIATPTAWLPGDTRRVFGSLEWYAQRLPTIFHLYRRGWRTEQIGRRLRPLGGGWAIERTLELAAGLIAERLNKRPLAA